jgi:inosine-uridine nucleoside N-ribohydrolase
MSQKKTSKVIYDTDPGVDDAMALYYALAHPEIDVVGITTTFGNVSVEQATTNALYLTAIAGREIPVTMGVGKPWVKPGEAPPDYIHGSDGLGNLPFRHPTSNRRDPRSSAQYIVDTVRVQPGEISIVAVGPLGNLALALAKEPELPHLVKQVILMGGAVIEPGNVSPVAEANIWNDPHAADRVLTAGWPLTMVGLDVTHQVILPVTLFQKIATHHQHPATDTLAHAVAFYANFYSGLYPHVAEIHGCFGHDVLAFIYLTNPELFVTEAGRLRVAVDGLAQGQTMMRRKQIDYAQSGWDSSIPDAQVCMKVDATGCKQVLESTLMAPWLRAR